MRAAAAPLLVLLSVCLHRDASLPESRASVAGLSSVPASGGTQAGIALARQARAELRSGPALPVNLPRGLTIYPGARVIGNTLVMRGSARSVLVEFETPEPIAKVIAFHRAQARAAGVTLTLDLAGTNAASIGGRTAADGEFAVTARRSSGATIVELSVSVPAGRDGS